MRGAPGDAAARLGRLPRGHSSRFATASRRVEAATGPLPSLSPARLRIGGAAPPPRGV